MRGSVVTLGRWGVRGYGGGVSERPGHDHEVLPEQTADDTDSGWGEARNDDPTELAADLERLRRDKPPHW